MNVFKTEWMTVSVGEGLQEIGTINSNIAQNYVGINFEPTNDLPELIQEILLMVLPHIGKDVYYTLDFYTPEDEQEKGAYVAYASTSCGLFSIRMLMSSFDTQEMFLRVLRHELIHLVQYAKKLIAPVENPNAPQSFFRYRSWAGEMFLSNAIEIAEIAIRKFGGERSQELRNASHALYIQLPWERESYSFQESNHYLAMYLNRESGWWYINREEELSCAFHTRWEYQECEKIFLEKLDEVVRGI